MEVVLTAKAMSQKEPWHKDKFYIGQEVLWNKSRHFLEKGENDFVYKIVKLNSAGGYAVVQGVRDRFRLPLYELRPKSDNEAAQITEIPFRLKQWRRRVKV